MLIPFLFIFPDLKISDGKVSHFTRKFKGNMGEYLGGSVG